MTNDQNILRHLPSKRKALSGVPSRFSLPRKAKRSSLSDLGRKCSVETNVGERGGCANQREHSNARVTTTRVRNTLANMNVVCATKRESKFFIKKEEKEKVLEMKWALSGRRFFRKRSPGMLERVGPSRVRALCEGADYYFGGLDLKDAKLGEGAFGVVLKARRRSKRSLEQIMSPLRS